MDRLFVVAVVAATFFFGWPIIMNRSGLSAPAQMFMYASVALAVAVGAMSVTPGAWKELKGNPLKFGLMAGALNTLGIIAFTYLLAHATKDHLIEPRHYKRVYRNQGWLSPVVLLGGRIVGVWFLKSNSGAMTVDVQPFARLSRDVRSGIEAEAAELGRFLDRRCEARITTG